MFGHQDENDSNRNFLDDPTPTSWPAQPAPDAAAVSDAAAAPTPAPQLLDSQATDGYVASAPVAPATAPVTNQPSTTQSDDLLDLKQQALQHLSPLVGQLDQSPEEKFRTTMMLIQASDNQNLLKEAFAAAQQITDDKQRAQALLDVINEINYFTQQGGAQQPA